MCHEVLINIYQTLKSPTDVTISVQPTHSSEAENEKHLQSETPTHQEISNCLLYFREGCQMEKSHFRSRDPHLNEALDIPEGQLSKLSRTGHLD